MRNEMKGDMWGSKKRKRIEDRIIEAAIRYVASWFMGDRASTHDRATELYHAVREHPKWPSAKEQR